MSNPYAHPHTMRKTHAKFQNNWYKTVRGVALTRDTHCLYNQGEKWLSWQCRKSDKNWSNNYVQSTCTSSYHEENTCKVSKQWVQNCKRSCAHKIPMLNVDGWTDGRTYENLHAYVFLLKQVRQKWRCRHNPSLLIFWWCFIFVRALDPQFWGRNLAPFPKPKSMLFSQF